MTAEEVWREACAAYEDAAEEHPEMSLRDMVIAGDKAAVSVIRTAMEAYAAEKVTMLTPEQIADGWIAHDGGPCPVPLGSRVTIMCRGGDTDTDEAHTWWWGRIHAPVCYEIIAYRPEPRHD